jgi:hypothetical protein
MQTLYCVLPSPLVPPSPPEPAPPSAGSEEPPDPPEFPSTLRPWSGLEYLGLHQLGLIQSIGSLVLGLRRLWKTSPNLARIVL